MQKPNVINALSMGLVMLELGVELRDWAKSALADGELDVMEASQLSEPIEKALNAAVKLPNGKNIVVNIHVVEIN